MVAASLLAVGCSDMLLTAQDAESVAAATGDLKVDFSAGSDTAESVTEDLTLPTAVDGVEGTSITWTSSPEGYVDPTTGAVTRPAYGEDDVAVTLTATITKGKVRETKTYTVTVKSESASLSSFSFSSPAATATIDGHEINASLPHGTDVTALVASFTVVGDEGWSLKVGDTAQVSGETANDFTSPVTYTVTAADGSTEDYTVTVTVRENSAKAITAFSVKLVNYDATTSVIEGDIDEEAGTIALFSSYGRDLTSGVATFSCTGVKAEVGGASQTSGVTSNDFSAPLTYTVTAANGSSRIYSVTLTEESPFTYTQSGGAATIAGLSEAWSNSILARKYNLVIPSTIDGYTVTAIGNAAFDGQATLKSITLASGITSIGTRAFADCTSLSSLSLNTGLESIGWMAFKYCSSLTRVVIPSSVTSINNYAFDACSGLKTISVLATTPPSIKSGTFDRTTALKYICVPSASVDAYKASSVWINYTAKICAPSGSVDVTFN